jgi:DNA-binding transcriptional regulator PaaX
MKIDSRLLRDRGYEALFLLGGVLALSVKPTLRHGLELEGKIGDILLRRREFRQLEANGLVETGGSGSEGIVRLTALGREVLNGGRLPEEAWSRDWDGAWRLLLFDLPRDARAVRAKFWRWLRASHFGRFQASVWITPDPVPEVSRVAAEAGLDDSLFTVFSGQVEGKSGRGPDVAAEAWDFQAINRGHESYARFAEHWLGEIDRHGLSPKHLESISREDRKQWGLAVQSDPLLPAELLPTGYQGKSAWKARQRLLARLLGSMDLEELR